MDIRKAYILIINSEDSFGIDANIRVFASETNAVSELEKAFRNARTEAGIPKDECDYGKNYYRVEMKNGSLLSGFLDTIFTEDHPQMQQGDAPATLVAISHILSGHTAAQQLLDATLDAELRFDRKAETKILEEYIKRLDSLETRAYTAMLKAEDADRQFWLSVDETDGRLDYALFYNKPSAQEYLACRHVQAAKTIFCNEENKIKAAQEQFRANGRMSFELQGNFYNAYGKIMEIKME